MIQKVLAFNEKIPSLEKHPNRDKIEQLMKKIQEKNQRSGDIESLLWDLKREFSILNVF